MCIYTLLEKSLFILKKLMIHLLLPKENLHTTYNLDNNIPRSFFLPLLYCKSKIIVFLDKQLRTTMKVTVYKSTIRPILLHGSENGPSIRNMTKPLKNFSKEHYSTSYPSNGRTSSPTRRYFSVWIANQSNTY